MPNILHENKPFSYENIIIITGGQLKHIICRVISVRKISFAISRGVY